MGLVALGERTVPAGIAAFLIAMLPVWVAVLGLALLRERLPRTVVVGIIVGIVGVGILVGPFGTSGGGLAFDPFGLLVLLCSPICWACRLAVLEPPGGPASPAADRDRPADAVRRRASCSSRPSLTGELRGFDLGAVTVGVRRLAWST